MSWRREGATGDSARENAIRELAEETGYLCRLVP
jgi:8-oxo-dGTP pyrophosphatase MutT (NUDIX family)